MLVHRSWTTLVRNGQMFFYMMFYIHVVLHVYLLHVLLHVKRIRDCECREDVSRRQLMHQFQPISADHGSIPRFAAWAHEPMVQQTNGVRSPVPKNHHVPRKCPRYVSRWQSQKTLCFWRKSGEHWSTFQNMKLGKHVGICVIYVWYIVIQCGIFSSKPQWDSGRPGPNGPKLWTCTESSIDMLRMFPIASRSCFGRKHAGWKPTEEKKRLKHQKIGFYHGFYHKKSAHPKDLGSKKKLCLSQQPIGVYLVYQQN